MSDCINPCCHEKDLHPVTVRSYDGCCSQLCEEIMDHQKTTDELVIWKQKAEQAEAENKELKAEVERLEEWCYTLGSAPDGSDESIKVWFEFNAWRDQYYMNKATQGGEG